MITIIIVSNPIREYLQMSVQNAQACTHGGFKPYKGVSSNLMLKDKLRDELRFKPYKGVSSNM